MTGGTFTSTAGTLSIEGGIAISNSTFTHNSGIVALDGAVCASYSVDASGISFNKVTISRSIGAGCNSNRSLTIVAGTTIPLGNSPSIVYKMSTSYHPSLKNNGTITAGTGALTLDMDGYYYGNLVNNGTLDFNSLSSVVLNASVTNNDDKTINVENITAFSGIGIDNSGTINADSVSVFTTEDITNNSGSVFVTAATPTFNVDGSFVINSGSTFPTSNVTLNITGDGCNNPTIDASSITFDKVTINKVNHSGCNSTKTLTIAAGTTIPLGNSPTITLDNSESSYSFDLVNNGTITTGTGTFTLNFLEGGTFTNSATGKLTANSLSAFTTTGSIVNSGDIDFSNIDTFPIGRSFTQNAGAEFLTADSPTFNVSGSFVINSGSTFPTSNVTLNITGDGCNNPTIDASSITFDKVTINKVNHSGCNSTKTLTIAAGTTIPLGNSPTITLDNSDSSYNFNLVNNGTITTGTGTFALNLYRSSTFTNSATGKLTANSLSAFTTTGSIVNSGDIDFSNIDTFPIDRSFTQNAGAEFLTADSPTFNVSGSFIVDSGSTFPTTGVDLNITGHSCVSPTINSPSITFGKVVIDKTNIHGDLCYSHLSLTIAAGTTIPLGNDPTINLRTYSVETYRFDLINNGTITTGTGTLNVDIFGSSTFTNNGTVNTSTLSSVTMSGNFSQGSTANFIGSDNLNINFLKTVAIDAGSSFPSTLGTVTLSNNTSYNNPKTTTYASVVKTGASTLALVQGFTVGDFSISAGTISNPASLQTINVTGNFSQTGGTLGGANLVFNFSSSGTQTINKTAGTFSSPFTVDKTNGTVSLVTDFSNAASKSCTVVEGIFDLNGKVFACGGDFVIQNGGTLRMMGTETPTAPILDIGSTVSFKGDGDAAPDTFTITNFTASYKGLSIDNAGIGGIDTFVLGAETTVNGNLTINSGVFDVGASNYIVNVSGNFALNGGTFNARAGTINLNGTSQSIDAATAVTFYTLTKNVVSTADLTFPASKSVIISNEIILTGALNNLLTIQSSTHETQATVNFPATQTMSYLAVHDINNIGTVVNTAGFNITNLGNNVGFSFNVGPTVTVPANITQITDGLGYISFTTTVADSDNDATKVKVEYSDDGGTS
ncbi:MAG: hypothetical protein WC422_01445 [Candidatus Paceibacterota bacterium]|jgi:hypothetical protein